MAGDIVTLMLRKKHFIIVITACLIVVAGYWMWRKPGCSIIRKLNPDVSCRVLDRKPDGTSLIEYFDADTNIFSLYVQGSDGELQIEHPYGNVKRFKNAIHENEIRFDPHIENMLLVNGEQFTIKRVTSN